MTTSKAKRTKTAQTEVPGPEILPVVEEKKLSKQSQVLSMLQRPEGATADQIMATTGWQKHSVRGFISGAVKKKLGLTVVAEKTEGGMVYRVAA
jgi:hypothetical protein